MGNSSKVAEESAALQRITENPVGPVVPAKQELVSEHGFSIRDVNPHARNSGGDINCVKCAIATDATLGGSPAQALPGLASPTFRGAKDILETSYGEKLNQMASAAAIENNLAAAGNGARGIVI